MRHYSRNEMDQVYENIVGQRLPGAGEQGVRNVSAVQNYVLNARKEVGPKVYRYGGVAAAGAATLALLHQSPVPAALQLDLVPSLAYPIGTRTIELTLGNAAVLANEYAGGWLYVNQGTGQGDCLRILSNPAALALATCVFTCIDATTIAMVVANTECSLVANPYSNVIVHPSPPTAMVIGVPEVTIPLSNFGWFQVKGPAAVVGTGVLVIDNLVEPSATVDGTVDPYVGATILDPVGKVLRVNATTDCSLVDLMIE